MPRLLRLIFLVLVVASLLPLSPILQPAHAQYSIDLIGAWYVPSAGRTLSVVIIQKPGVSDAAVNDVVTTITSTATVNGQYIGWQGAFPTTIPLSFAVSVTTSPQANGDIVITLKKGTGNILGSTQTSKSGGYIVSAKIMLSGAAFGNTLSSDQLQSISRHEFGHAVGLGHATDPSDLMYPTMNSVPKYISTCDISAINVVYTDPTKTSAVC